MAQPLLPVEIVGQIIEQVALSDHASTIYQRLATLRSCRSVCHTLNDIVLPHLYRHIPFNGPHSFAKFLDELRAVPERGRFVRTLDFSAFTSVGLGRSRSCNTRILLLTASTLNECLRLCPNVREVFLSEALESDIDAQVLKTLFTGLKHIKALDFCASDCQEFVDGFTTFLDANPEWDCGLSNLSLHNCSTLPPTFFQRFLPHFPSLERLDLYNTQVPGIALVQLPLTCRLSVLNLSQCTRITANALVAFATSHPASKTLKKLNLLFSWNKTHPLSTVPQALDKFLLALPRDLQVLDLAGCELDLQSLSFLPRNLLELGAHDIDIGDHYSDQDSDEISEELVPTLLNLRYLLLTQNVISSETKFAAILARLFPKLAIIESPGFSKLPFISSLTYQKIFGIGRRDWIVKRCMDHTSVEQNNAQYHPRKSNMSMIDGVPRGIYDYYSYRV